MGLTKISLILAVFFFSHVHGQCVPNSVLVLLLNPNATLLWETHPREPCEITQFQVDIVGHQGDEFHFKVTDNYVDLTFLNECEEWVFTVTVISNDVLGFPRTLTSFIPLPANTDITLRYFNASVVEGREVLLEWELITPFARDCALVYRLTITDEEIDITQDVYVQGKALRLTLLSPCVAYQFGLRAISRGEFETIEGPLKEFDFEIPAKPQERPTLTTLDIQATSIDMTWTLEGSSNRCPLRALYIDAGSYFNVSVPIQNSLSPDPVPVSLKSLRANSMYYLRVYVENSGGASQATPIAIQTLDYSAVDALPTN